VTTNTEEFCSRVLITAEALEPTGSSTHDSWAHGHSLDICHCGGAPVQASISWEGRLQSGATGFSLERFDETSLLTADVGTCTTVDNDIEVVTTSTSVLADKTLCIGLINCTLELNLFVPKLASHIDVGGLSPHAEAYEQSTFYKFVWVMSQNLTIFASSGLGLVSIDHQVGWSVQIIKVEIILPSSK